MQLLKVIHSGKFAVVEDKSGKEWRAFIITIEQANQLGLLN